MCYTGTNEVCTGGSGCPRASFYVQNREVVTVAVDWLAIRNDYINGGGSYRKLAEKYGVPLRTIAMRGKDENWPEARAEQRNKIATELQQKTAEVIVQKEVKRAQRMMGIHDQLLDKLEQAVSELNMAQVTNKKKTKVIEYRNGKRPDKPTKETITENEEILAVSSIVDRKGLQQISLALKALWDISNEHEASRDDDDVEDDGLLAALGANAEELFSDGDDSGILPKEKEA